MFPCLWLSPLLSINQSDGFFLMSFLKKNMTFVQGIFIC